MQKKYKQWLLILLLLVGGSLVWALLRPTQPEPVYAGQPESAWIASLSTSFSQLRMTRWQWDKLGTNSWPILFKAVKQPNLPFYKQYKNVWALLPGRVQKHLPFPIDGAAVRTNAAMLIVSSEDFGRTTPNLIRLLEQSKDPDVRHIAVWSLGLDVDSYDKAATAALVHALNDPDQEVRAATVMFLSMAGRDQSLAIPALLGCLTDANPKIREGALASLDAFPDGTEIAINHLIEIFSDKDPQKRAIATNTLTRIAPNALVGSLPK